MPKYAMNDDDMEEAYGSSTPVKPPGEEEAPESPPESVDQENAEEPTAVISNKILSPEGESLKPGDEVVLRVVENFGDESSVKYAPKGEGESETDYSEPMSTEGKELAALSEEGA